MTPWKASAGDQIWQLVSTSGRWNSRTRSERNGSHQGRVAEILQEYSDIADVMEIFGVRVVATH
jgi:hypothetical protein